MGKIEFEFEYKYFSPQDLLDYKKLTSEVPRRAVRVYVIVSQTSTSYEGISVCNPKDRFSKAVGRKLAVTSAIRTLAKPLRTKVWEAYFNMCKN